MPECQSRARGCPELERGEVCLAFRVHPVGDGTPLSVSGAVMGEI